MEMLFYYILVYFVEGIILWQYCSRLFVPKTNVPIRIFLLSILYSTLAVIFTIKSVNINALLFLCANFIFMLFAYNVSYISALFHSLLTTVIMGLTELAVANFLPDMLGNYFVSPDFKQNFVVHAILSKSLYFLILYFISHILSPSTEQKQPIKKELLLLLIIPFLSVWIAISLLHNCITYQFPDSVNRSIIICSFILLVINLMTWIIYGYMQRKNRDFTRMQLQLQKEQDTTEYYKMLSQQHENQQILIHDIKKHLHSLEILNEQGQNERISAYIKQLINSSNFESTTYFCNNDVLNAILCRYASICKKIPLIFSADIRSGSIDFINDDDITSLFCNLLDNAVTAAQNYPNGYVELSAYSREDTNMTIISMVNSCRVNPFDKNGKLRSTKKDSFKHGFGLKSVERIVSCYNGEMQYYYNAEDYTFHMIIIMKKTSP